MRTVVSTRLDADATIVFLLLIADDAFEIIKNEIKDRKEGRKNTLFVHTYSSNNIQYVVKSKNVAIVCTHMIY